MQIICVCLPTREVLEGKYASCKNTFQAYREYYCQRPLAQKLLALQTEKEEIERRIEAYDGEITIKEKELTHLTGNKACCYCLPLSRYSTQSVSTLWIFFTFCLKNPTDVCTNSKEITKRYFFQLFYFTFKNPIHAFIFHYLDSMFSLVLTRNP